MASKDTGLQSSFGVDYVICFRFATSDKPAAVASFEKLIQALANVGLATEVRNGEKHSLLVFVKVASQEHLFGEVYRSRVRDWIHGVRAAAPDKETRTALEADPLYEAERLRIIYQLITNPTTDGGAGITPKQGEWKNVESVFPLHDHEGNKKLMKKLSTSYFLTTQDLDEIRDKFGEKIAFYFAFTQSYFSFLFFPAAAGAGAWLLLGHFSSVYAVISTLWCIVFTEYWKHQEVDLAVRWGVRNVSKIETHRKEFNHEKEMTDPVTGEQVRVFSNTKRLQRQLLQIPFAAAVAMVLGSLIATCFGIEVFISEVYDGPLKWLLVFLPTGILTTVMPVLVNIFTTFATRLTAFENYDTQAAYDTAMTRKIFIINFITSYLGIFLTAFVYVPFGTIVVPYLDVFSLTVRPFAENEKQMKISSTGFQINPDRLRKQVIYFTVTAQVVNQVLEVVLPFVKRAVFSKYKKMQSERALNNGGGSQVGDNDHPDEAKFLARVRQEAELDVYDVTADLREMVLQFGYLSLFSVVWPLTACSFIVNDWFELRTDAFKICVEMQRPTPARADTIGPWLDSLSFLTWLGSITTSALVYLFSNDGLGPGGNPKDIKAWALLLTIFFAEHIFLVARWGVQHAISKLESPGLQKERRERFLVRKRYFDESLSELQKYPPMSEKAGDVVITRKSLEEDQRVLSQGGNGTVEEKFWLRQRGWKECAQVGSGIIERSALDDGETKKEL